MSPHPQPGSQAERPPLTNRELVAYAVASTAVIDVLNFAVQAWVTGSARMGMERAARALPFLTLAVVVVLLLVRQQLAARQRLIVELQRSRLGAEHVRRHLTLLAQGAQALVGFKGDERNALQALVDVMVPEFADWCAIDAVEDGEIRRLAVAHARADVGGRTPELVAHHPGWVAPVRRVMAAGRSELDWVTQPGRSPAADADQLAVTQALGLESWLVVPLRIQGLHLGTISCGTAAGRRGFRPADVTAVEALASRTAEALERIALFREAQRAAEEAERRTADLRRAAIDNARLYETVRAGEEHLRALVEAAPLAIIEFGAGGQVRQCNTAARALLGSSADEPDTVTFPPETAGVLAQVVADSAGGSPVTGAEALVRRADGTEIVLSLFGAVLRDAAGAVDGVLVLAADVSARHRLEEQLVRARRIEAVGQVAGGVAHDFNNLLTVVLGHAALLATTLPDDDPRRADVDAISMAAERAAAITSQLLTISRGDLVSAEAFDPRARLTRLTDTLRSLLPSPISLVVDVTPGDGLVRMSPAQFDQVVLNLGLNARDAMAERGTLTVRLREDADTVVLTVSDTGQGMDAVTAERCYEPFFTTKGGVLGTGLGLATVHSVVTGAGGEVGLETRPGVGTTFSVRLPRVTGAMAAPVLEPRTAGARGSERILVVENEDGLRRLAVEVLRSAGYVVTPAADGQAALQAVAQEVPDLVVSDVVMPRMGGVELARHLSEQHPGVPVLFMTGYVDQSSRDSLLGAEVLIKPFLIDELVARVGEILERARAGARGS